MIAAHFTFRGEWSFASASEAVRVGPGEAYLRWNDRPWDFGVAHRTHALGLNVSMGEVRPRVSGGGLHVSQARPSARLLLAHLRNCVELRQFGIAARNATIELFQGLIDDQVIDDEHLSPALVKAAREHIATRLLDDPDMGPAAVASALHVSVRTLNRALERESSSVTTYIRSECLQRARKELIATSWTVSELAARWHFADTNHFIKAYKRQFGETPSSSRRALDGRATHPARVSGRLP
ncbi:MAG TPA: helix-turn-helix transcriptional regulator [Trebonia sp.]